MKRLERDRPFIMPFIKPADSFSFKEVLRSASSPHVILVFIMFFMAGTMLYGLALFLPSIVNQLGFSSNKSQLLSVGPFAAGFFGEQFIYFFRSAQYIFSQGLFSVHFSSDYNFCILLGPLSVKRYHNGHYFPPCRYRFRSLSR